MHTITKKILIRQVVCSCFLFIAFAACAQAQQMRHHTTENGHAASPASPPRTFVASTAKPFPVLMDDAMAVMHYGMAHAPMNGIAEHDFVTMMIPHHQGAIDMAKALLLTTTDLELRNLAQGIITEQQNEMNVMQAWLQRDLTKQSGDAGPVK